MLRRRRRRRGILNTLFGRRTIRSFKQREISKDVLRLLVEAGQRAPCSLQSYTVINITSSEIKEKLVEITEEELLKKSPTLILICIDLNRTTRLFNVLSREHVLKSDKHPMESVEAIFEAGLFVENIIIAAEALGIGSVMIDSALYYAEEVARLLNLPRGVVPLIFLCMGQPNEKPPLRPRLPIELVFHENSYREASEEELKRYIEEASNRLAREGYLMKYANIRATYSEYLSEKISIDKQLEKRYSSLSNFLAGNGLRIG